VSSEATKDDYDSIIFQRLEQLAKAQVEISYLLVLKSSVSVFSKGI
jgi:hypothetical protein